MTYLKSWFSASKMTKCQIRLKKMFFSSFSTFLTLFSRIEWFGTKKKSKNFFDFFGFFRIFSKCQNLSTGNLFFSSKQVKIDFFHFIFANWVIWNKRRKKNFFDRIRDFLFFGAHPTRQNAQNLDFESFPGHAVFSRG